MTLPDRTYAGLATFGTLSQPTSGRVEVTDIKYDGNTARIDFKFRGARISVTDSATGSYGSLKFFDFEQQAVALLGSRQDYTSYVVDGAGVLATASFEIGIGSTAIAAFASGTLGDGVNENIGTGIAQVLTGGTTTGTTTTNAKTLDGTGTPLDLCLNWSGTTATIATHGYIDVNGTFSLAFMFLGDD